jgi:hypothetical protein
MSVYFNVQINLIEEIAEKTIRDENFNPDNWSLYDSEILIKAGELIKREILAGEKENKRKDKNL